MQEPELPEREGEVLSPDDALGDYLDVVASFTSVIPVLGGAISNVFSGWSQQRRMERIREVLDGLQRRLVALGARVDDAYVRGQEFEDLLDQTLRRVAQERHEEKRRLYREFLLGAITSLARYDEQLRVVRVLEELQLAHIDVLRAVVQEPRPAPGPVHAGAWLPELARRLPSMSEDVVEDLVEQLKDVQILRREETTIRLPRPGEAAGAVFTRFGQRFVDFIRRI
jgi:hypothetical protein